MCIFILLYFGYLLCTYSCLLLALAGEDRALKKIDKMSDVVDIVVAS